MDCTDLYSTASLIAESYSTHKTKILLGKCAQALLRNVPSFLFQAYSEISLNLLLNVSCTLPNAFSYNLKVTLHLLQS